MTTHVLLGLVRTRRFALAGVLGAALFAACASRGQTVRVPWRAGNAERFQMGAVEERRAQAAQGLQVNLILPWRKTGEPQSGDGAFSNTPPKPFRLSPSL
jgi:hypothetical protein